MWLNKGDGKTRDEACKLLRDSLFIVWDMVRAAMEACDEMDVRAVVAPFEADSRLVAMCLVEEVDFVVNKDSDLIIIVHPVFFLDSFRVASQLSSEHVKCISSMANVTFLGGHKMISDVLFATLCGCDYV